MKLEITQRNELIFIGRITITIRHFHGMKAAKALLPQVVLANLLTTKTLIVINEKS